MSWGTTDLGAPAEVAAGSAVHVNPRTPIWFGLSGTFSATLKFQWSPDASGSVWYDIGSALTASGMAHLPAGLARRIRVNTTGYSSGTPVAVARFDTATDAFHRERDYAQETLEAKASVAAGTAKAVPEGCQATVMLSGTFVATVRVQVSLSDSGSDWYNWGQPFSAGGAVVVPRGLAARVRLNTTAFTSGTPAAVLSYGKAAEGAPAGWVEAISSGALNLFATLNSLTIAGTVAYTLSDGFYVGQEVAVYVTSVSGVPVGTLTPTNFADGSSMEFTKAGQFAVLAWTIGGWKVKASSVGQTYETALSLRARVATTTNGTLATAFANGQTVDGVALVTGDLVLLKDQSTGAENGLYVVQASGAPVRSVDFDEAQEVVGGVRVAIQEGTVNADSVWMLTNDGAVVVGTTSLVFAQIADTVTPRAALPPVRAATTTNGTLATAFANGQTIDGVSLVTGDRILVKDQNTGAENGIYVVQASGAPVRASDYNAAAKISGGQIVAVKAGTVNADTVWMLVNDGAVTPGSTTMTFNKISDDQPDVEYAGSHAVGKVDFNGAANNAETIIIGTETYTLLTGGIVAPFDFTGGTANAQAISLGAVINSDTAQPITAVVVDDTVFIFADNVGTAGNLTMTNTLSNTTKDDMVGGAAAAEKHVDYRRYTVTASDVQAGQIHIPIAFVPAWWDWKLYDSSGVEKVDATNAESFDGAITVAANPNRLVFAQGTNLAWAATDVLHVIAYN